MAIRFLCGACQQAIEIDDEWALRSVVCPFCRGTVTAPERSTLEQVSAIPVARDAFKDIQAPQSGGAGPLFSDAAPIPTTNLTAVSALVAAVVAVGLFLMAMMVLQPHEHELTEVRAALETGGPQAMVEAQQQLIEKHGGLPPWLLNASVLMAGSFVAWLTALVCGVLGLRGKRRRGLSTTALLIAGLLPVLVCCGGGI